MCADSSCSPEVKKYRESVWDMFQSEAKYLTKFLQPLELVYKTFLEELHFHQILKVADVDKIFANLSELCEVCVQWTYLPIPYPMLYSIHFLHHVQLSSDVANNLFTLFDCRHGNKIAPVSELIKAFSMVREFKVHARIAYVFCLSLNVLVWSQVQPSLPAILCQL